MTFDFPNAMIEINGGTEDWGPYSFDFTSAIPAGDSLVSATVTSLLLLGGTDSTTALIAPGSVAVVGNAVQLRLQFPGAAFIGSHVLNFLVECQGGAQQRFTFGYVVVGV